MGKGRNRRHRARRKEKKKPKQSLKAKLDKRREKKEQKKQRQLRKKRMSMRWYRDDRQHIRMGLPATFLVEDKHKDFVGFLKKLYDCGKVNDILFFVDGKFNSRTKKRLRGLIEEYGNGWAWGHVIFRLSGEFQNKFIERFVESMFISHFVGLTNEQMKTVVMSPFYHKLKMYYWNPGEDTRKQFFEWLTRHNPQYVLLHDQGEDAEHIINTGLETTESFDVEWLGT